MKARVDMVSSGSLPVMCVSLFLPSHPHPLAHTMVDWEAEESDELACDRAPLVPSTGLTAWVKE